MAVMCSVRTRFEKCVHKISKGVLDATSDGCVMTLIVLIFLYQNIHGSDIESVKFSLYNR